jgi:hypothetical protein
MRRYGVIFLITSLLLMVITSIAAGEEKPYQGSTVRVLLEDTPWHRNIESAIPKFQEQTGISVFMEFLPSESERERTNLKKIAQQNHWLVDGQEQSHLAPSTTYSRKIRHEMVINPKSSDRKTLL